MARLFFTIFCIIAVTEPAVSQNTAGTCSRRDSSWHQTYRLWQTYVPQPGNAQVKVHCNIIVWQDDSARTNWQNTPEDRQRLRNLIEGPQFGLNFQMYERYIPPSDPILPPEEEVHTKNVSFVLEDIYFIRNSRLARSIGIHDKYRFLRDSGYTWLLDQVNINITTGPPPVPGAWGHAQYPGYDWDMVPMITTTDDPNQIGYEIDRNNPPVNAPVSLARDDQGGFLRDWSFMEHLAHELGHCLDLKHVYAGKVAMGYEACRVDHPDYLADIFPRDAPWCDKPRRGCDVCVQISDGIPADRHPADGRTNNLMNGRGGRYLSPGQLGIMHRALATKSIARAASGFSDSALIITRDEVWDFERQLYRPLRIASGASLTLRCTLHMPPQGAIYIEPGGRLLLEGGIVTGSNPNAGLTWPGVIFAGNHRSTGRALDIRQGGALNNIQRP